ncbi:MAG: type IV pilus modification protein PilV [Gammaproteobacteria bacterium]
MPVMNATYVNRQRGMTLVEVLIAILIFAIGLLGIAALQVSGLRYTKSSQTRSVAAIQAENMVDRMRANETAVANGMYLALGAETVNCDNTACAPQEMANYDFNRWLGETRQALGVKRFDGALNTDNSVNATICLDSTPQDGTDGAWACDGAGNVYAIKIEWRERTSERGGVTDTYSNTATASGLSGFVLNRFVMRFWP